MQCMVEDGPGAVSFFSLLAKAMVNSSPADQDVHVADIDTSKITPTR